mmetsp:Transcript_50989/g.51933  ORF Transcript_50989/g.51933 Transcript_50989/m.51933 type:complete len:101 (-) Transcript_50989:102-404(-)
MFPLLLLRLYLDDTDKGSLITLFEHNLFNRNGKIIHSHDKTTTVIQDKCRNKGWLLSIDNHYSCSVQKLNFPGSVGPVLLHFTLDNECIIIFWTKLLECS